MRPDGRWAWRWPAGQACLGRDRSSRWSQSITGPVVQAAAVVAVVVFGAGIAMSENGSSMRRGLGIMFGLCIAFAASTFFLDFFGFAGGAEIG